MATFPKVKVTGDSPHMRDLFPSTGERHGLCLFSSPEAMARYVQACDKSQAWARDAWESRNNKFYSDSMTNAISMATDGWTEGRDRVAKMRDSIVARNPQMKQPARWGVAGAIPNVPRYLSGNPAHMRMIDNAKARRKVVITLLSDTSTSWYVDHSTITNRAAVVAAIVDSIEGAGFACNVITFNNTVRNIRATIAVQVKESHQAVDIGRMAYGLGHAAMFRRLMFACKMADSFFEALTSTLGTPTKLDIAKANEAGNYVLPSVNDATEKFQSEEKAATAGLAYLIEALRKQRCPAFPELEAAA